MNSSKNKLLSFFLLKMSFNGNPTLAEDKKIEMLIIASITSLTISETSQFQKFARVSVRKKENCF